MQCTRSPLCYNSPPPPPPPLLLVLLGIFSEFPFTMYVNNHKNPFTQVQTTIRQQSSQFRAYSVIKVRENPTSVQNSMSPLLLYVPSVTARSPLLLTIFFIYSLQPWRFFIIIVHRSIVPKSGPWNMVYLVFLSDIYYLQAIKVLASVMHNEETITNFLIIAKWTTQLLPNLWQSP